MTTDTNFSKTGVGVDVELLFVRKVLKQESLMGGGSKISPDLLGDFNDLLRVLCDHRGKSIDRVGQVRSGPCGDPDQFPHNPLSFTDCGQILARRIFSCFHFSSHW